MITATVKHNDNYADIEFPCSEAYLSAKLTEKAPSLSMGLQ